MSWVAEILRRQHRVCAHCRLGPTHLYEPVSAGAPDQTAAEEPSGTPLCNACLESRLTLDFGRFAGRCLLFEPALGPDAFGFTPLQGVAAGPWPEEHRAAARSWLERMEERCAECGGPGRFLWIPVEADANLWAEDWLGCLHDGTLTPAHTLCGRCAVTRLVRSMDERGLYFEAITPPGDDDGILCGCESS